MNQIEITIFGISMLLLAGYTAFPFSDGWKARSFSIPLLLAPLVYLALESTTEFLSNDAAFHFFREIYNFGTSDMNQYRLGGFRTSEMLLAPLVPVITKIVQTPIEVAAILKGIHWLFGFLLLLWIHAASQPLVVGNRVTYFMLFMVVALLLPTNILALKIFNYDKLSLFLGLLGLIYVLRALSSHDPGQGSNKESTKTPSKAWHLAFTGLVCLVLAAQEKLIASPFMWLSMPVFSFLLAHRIQMPGRHLRFLLGSCAAVSTVLLISSICYLELGLVRGTFNAMTPFDILRPLERIAWPLLQKSLLVTGPGATILLSFTLMVTYLGTISLSFISGSAGLKKWADSHLLTWLKLVYVFALGLFIVSVFWAYNGEIFLGPFKPVSEGRFMPGVSFNGGFWHFDSVSFPAHMAQLILADVAIFVTAIPSAIWLMVIFLVSNEWRYNSTNPQPAMMLLILMAFTMLVIPILFALTQTPVVPRYFNLFIFGFVLFLLIRINPYLTNRKNIAITAGLLLPLLLVEVAIYRPVFGIFQPAWLIQSDQDLNRNFQPGQLGPINRWWGWGEEVMLAGRIIEESCAPEKCSSIRLHTSYPGIWLKPKFVSMGRVSIYTLDDSSVAYTESDFFIVSRASILQNETRFPDGIDPYATVEFAGYVQAYIFRGDVLEENGFRF